ncbi:MAG: TonB-dependent receptor [Pseudomonadales bacterium]
MNQRITCVTLVQLGLFCMLSAGTTAQNAASYTLEEVIVTAQKRSQSLQDVPISVAVETAASIEKKGILDLSSLSNHTPNLFIEDGGATANIAMRGLGSPGIESIEPSVGTYIDSISLARPRGVTQNPFYDLDRIEVLRGPQGTLWGRNTIAGAINIVTAKPGEEFEGHASLEVGNFSSHALEAAVSGPLVPSLYGRLSIYNAERDGYLDNEGIGPDGGGLDSEAYRGQLLWKPSDTFDALLKYEHVNHAQLGHAIQIVGAGPTTIAGEPNIITPMLIAAGEDFETDTTQRVNGTGLFDFVSNNPRQSNSSDLAALTLNLALGEYTLTSTTGYIDYEAQRVMEFSGGPLNVIGLGGQEGDTVEFLSQELRLTSPKLGNFSFIGGLYYDDLEVVQTPLDEGGGAVIDAIANSTILIARNGDVEDVSSYSAYVEGTYEFSEQWIASAGIRVGEEDKKFTDFVGLEILGLDSGVFGAPPGQAVFTEDGGSFIFGQQAVQDLERDDSYLTWSAKLQYFTNDDVMFYVTAATGFKSGGFNNGGNTLILEDKVVSEEESLSIEGGAKMTVADGRGRINIAVFRTEFDDLQVSRTDTTGVLVTTNAAEATTQGVELDASWRLAENWTIGGSYAYLDAEYDDFPNAPCGPFLQEADPVGCMDGQDLGGERLQRAPENSGSLYVEYVREIAKGWEFTSYLGWSFRDETFTVISNEFESDSLSLLDARFELRNADAGWVVAVKGKNLTDEDSLILRQDNALLQGAQFGAIVVPRTYALQVKKLF